MGGKWWRRLLLILLGGQCPRLGGHFPDPSNPPPKVRGGQCLYARCLELGFFWTPSALGFDSPLFHAANQPAGRPR